MEQLTTQMQAAGYSPAAAVYDIVFVLVLLLTVARGIRRGLISSLLDLLSIAGSTVGGAWLAGALAPALYENHIGAALGERVAAEVLEHGRELTEVLHSIPLLPVTLQDTLAGIIQSAGDAAVPQLVTAMEPVVLPLLQCIIFLPAFLILRLLIGLLAKAMTGANRLPLVGGLNKALGGAVGLGVGLVDGWALAWVLWLAAGITNGAYSFLAPAALEGSFFWRLFAGANPFLTR